MNKKLKLIVQILIICTFSISILIWYKVSAEYLPFGSDFTQDYCAARQWVKGGEIFGDSFPELCKVETGIEGIQNFHPPAYSLLVLPLGFFSYSVASWIWSAILFVSIIVGVRLVIQGKDVSLTLMGTLFLFWAPIIECYGLSSISPILGVGVSFLLLKSKNNSAPVKAGIILGILTAVKLFPGVLLLHYLLFRQKRTLVSALGTAVFIYLCCFVLFGTDPIYRYFTVVVPQNLLEWEGFVANISLRGVAASLFSYSRWSVPLVESAVCHALFLVVGYVVVLGALVYGITRCVRFNRPEISLALCVLASLLLSPITWTHALVLLMSPLFLVWRDGDKICQRLLITAALCGAIPSYENLRFIQEYFDVVKIPPHLLILTKWGFFTVLLVGIALMRLATIQVYSRPPNSPPHRRE